MEIISNDEGKFEVRVEQEAVTVPVVSFTEDEIAETIARLEGEVSAIEAGILDSQRIIGENRAAIERMKGYAAEIEKARKEMPESVAPAEDSGPEAI